MSTKPNFTSTFSVGPNPKTSGTGAHDTVPTSIIQFLRIVKAEYDKGKNERNLLSIIVGEVKKTTEAQN